ncbi:hypothetical protein HH303_18820 [Rhodospirillaceae bacterium KN72]|uniref:ATP synthase gamma chain n=1 Tax=Pacificispira spongiicola TaxID=2729598 RepID=A0A7Y0HG59_9PROT|nr:F0F1 ATP synthase subunit gamma [Pacificispira spongiicola]NMM46551.1 hypothetical protein [Pacificispira spongiicola]
MEQLSRIKDRIGSLEDLGGLIRALRAMSASHVQEAQGALPGIVKYVEAVEGAIAEALALSPGLSGRDMPSGQGAADVVIVICAEHGFVGAFNERLLDRAAAELADRPNARLAIVGRRGAMLAEERGIAPEWSFPMAIDVASVLGVTRHTARVLSDAAHARIAYAEYRPGGNYEVVVKTILPIDPAVLTRAGASGAPMHHLAPDLLLERLADEYLFSEITRAVMQSLASENGARLRVMESADRSIGDKLNGLHRDERVLRQEAITSELLDVVVGSEAVSGPGRR